MSTAGPLIIITGASSGIGLAAARSFAQRGHALLLIARHMTLPDALAGHPVHCADVDVGDFDRLNQAVRDAEEIFGPAEGLINCAGLADARPFSEVSSSDYEHEIRTNLLGTMNGVKTVFDGMVERKRGTIINITSVSDRKTCAVSVGYTASKYGVRAVSESLREAAAPARVRVVNLAPGYVRTNIHNNMGISLEKYEEMLGHPDFMTPEEVAEIIRYTFELPPHICIRDLVVTPTRSIF